MIKQVYKAIPHQVAVLQRRYGKRFLLTLVWYAVLEVVALQLDKEGK